MFQLSYWEKESCFEGIDVCIIGSGIVGLSTALNLKLLNPELKVLVVDRGFLPYGASTRNAGFACFGSMTELLDDLDKESEEDVFNLVKARWEGLLLLRKTLGDTAINYEPFGGYEVFTSSDKESYEKCMDNRDRFNKLLFQITGDKQVYSDAGDKIAKFGLGNTAYLIENSLEGQINTGKMMRALYNYVIQQGVIVINGLGINEVTNQGSSVTLTTTEQFTFSASKVIITTNGFAPRLLPELNVVPARAQVLITKPVADLRLKGSFHYEKGFYYFRNVGDRVLFGGGRNLDFKGEQTDVFGLTTSIQEKLNHLLSTVILPNNKFEVDMRWSGIMGLGTSKSTIVKKVDGNIYCAVRMGGMGVAIGSSIGKQAAGMVLQ